MYEFAEVCAKKKRSSLKKFAPKKESKYLSGNLGQNQLNTAPPAFTVSIVDLFKLVKEFLPNKPDYAVNNEMTAKFVKLRN